MNPTPPTDIASLLDMASPALTVGEVETIAWEIFGLNAQAQELAGERDRNYHLREGQTDYVLKVSNPAESRPVIDFQILRLAPYCAGRSGTSGPEDSSDACRFVGVGS